MIPFFEWHAIVVGPLTFQVWGLFVALGFIAGILLSRFRLLIIKPKAQVEWIWDLGVWVLVGSLIGARLGHVFFYEWSYFSKHLGEILFIWNGGMSSYGGFIGGLLAFYLFVRKQKLDFWPIAESVLWAFPFGMLIGRLGCSFIHDHQGKLTSMFFGVQYPGGTRFDLGILEVFALLPLVIAFFALRRKKFKVPVFTITTFLYYGITRFLLDFLRATDIAGADARYAGLTPAQYGSILLVVVGIILITRKVRIVV